VSKVLVNDNYYYQILEFLMVEYGNNFNHITQPQALNFLEIT